MAHVSGPTSSMPGSFHAVPEGTMCDDHPNEPATARIQGETDSFGAEYRDACSECAAAFTKEREDALPRAGYCEWHRGQGANIKLARDFEEGTSGRLYETCEECRQKMRDALDAERADMDDGCDPYDAFEPIDPDDEPDYGD